MSKLEFEPVFIGSADELGSCDIIISSVGDNRVVSNFVIKPGTIFKVRAKDHALVFTVNDIEEMLKVHVWIDIDFIRSKNNFTTAESLHSISKVVTDENPDKPIDIILNITTPTGTAIAYTGNLIPENKLYHIAGVLEYIASLYTRDYLNEKNEDIWIEFRATADLPDDYSEWITELNKSEIMLTYNNTENNDEETKEDNQ